MNEEININENVSSEAAPAVTETKIDAVSEKAAKAKAGSEKRAAKKAEKKARLAAHAIEKIIATSAA